MLYMSNAISRKNKKGKKKSQEDSMCIETCHLDFVHFSQLICVQLLKITKTFSRYERCGPRIDRLEMHRRLGSIRVEKLNVS
eukprot:snap_masked-scaffold_1-processed-gene-24.54-mRNA-1 protein AED:1.00 eAED:1.00 QI:0/-1/0/0/-1/1/1/0/81